MYIAGTSSWLNYKRRILPSDLRIPGRSTRRTSSSISPTARAGKSELTRCRRNLIFEVFSRLDAENNDQANVFGILGGRYKICAQPDLPACDAYHWLWKWRQHLQDEVYQRPLLPDDYIFPAIGANGIVQTGEHLSHDDVNKWIKEFAAGAKLPQQNGTFSTHCFRRGGAQYRFMFAAVGRRWTLRQVRWWGGWAEGEHVGALIEFVLHAHFASARHSRQIFT